MPNPFEHHTSKLKQYLFPENYTISLHHSSLDIDILFRIRLFSLIYLTGIYIWSIAMTKSLLINIIYLTMNGYFFTWLYFMLVIQDYYINGNNITKVLENKFPIANNLKYYIEIIYQTAFAVELPITLVFWTVLFKILINMSGVTTMEIAVNANLHAGPLICLVIELFYNTCKFPRRHFLAVVVSSLIYLVINLLYSLIVHPVYKPIDWVSFLSYILCLLSIVLAYLNHWFGRFIFYKLKKHRLQNRIVEGLIDFRVQQKSISDKQQLNTQPLKNKKQDHDIDDEDINVSVTDDL